MRDNDGCGVALLALLAIPLAVIVSSIANGFVLTVLWGWFVVPIFAAPSLSIAQAIGLSMMVRYLTYQPQKTKIEEEKEEKEDKSLTEWTVRMLMDAILYPVIVLAIGWVVHLFV